MGHLPPRPEAHPAPHRSRTKTMNDEERQIITRYVERVAGVSTAAPASTGPWGARSVPSTQPNANLPPVDPDADRLITDLFARHPEARYRLTQTAFVQEAALVNAQNRIQELEWQLENTQNQAQAAQQQPRGMFGGLFGGGGRQQQVPMTPRPQQIPQPMGMNPGMMQGAGGGGGGFLRTAAMTAAGVAGGLVLGNMLMGAMGGGGAAQAASAAGATGASGGAFGEQNVATPDASPWTNPGGNDAAPVSDQSGGWDGGNDAAAYDQGGGYDDAGGFDEEV